MRRSPHPSTPGEPGDGAPPLASLASEYVSLRDAGQRTPEQIAGVLAGIDRRIDVCLAIVHALEADGPVVRDERLGDLERELRRLAVLRSRVVMLPCAAVAGEREDAPAAREPAGEP